MKFGKKIILKQKFIIFQVIHRVILLFIFLKKKKFSLVILCFLWDVEDFLKEHMNKCLISLNKIKKLPKDTEIYCGHEYTLKNSEVLFKMILKI